MATLKKPDDNLAYNSNEHVVWRARAPNGALLLEYVPQGTEGQTVVVEACRFRHLGASSTVMPDFDPSARFGGGPKMRTRLTQPRLLSTANGVSL